MLESVSGFELGWMVGFLEGEGSFCGYVYQKGKYMVAHLNAVASQVQREPLERLARYIGHGKIRGPRAPKRAGVTSEKWSPIYTFMLDGRKALEFMREIRPHMSPKRQGQIDTAITKYLAHRRTPYAERAKKNWETRRSNGWRHPGFKGRFGPRMQLITTPESGGGNAEKG